MNEKEKQRQTKLSELQDRHSELTRLKGKLKHEMGGLIHEITEINKELKKLGIQIFDLKNVDGDTPHITDHAVVRYLERVKGLNIWDIKAEIAQHQDAVRVDNTIVTVNGNEEVS